MMNKISTLTKIFSKSFYQNLKIYNKEEKKIQKNSIIFWAIIIIAITIFYISQKIINELVIEGQPEIFLYIYFLILTIFLTFQTILVATNVYFFSKDMEYILPMPISPLELLLAKFNTLLSMAYISEAIFGFVPLLMYGIKSQDQLGYYVLMLLVLLIFPILIVTLISILTVFFMKFAKYFKNKQFFQAFITSFLTFSVLIIEIIIMSDFLGIGSQNLSAVQDTQEAIDPNLIKEEYSNLTKNFLIINPTVEILKKDTGILNMILNLLKLIAYNALALILFLFIGRKVYIKNILESVSQTKNKKNKNKKVKYQNKNTRHKVWSYLKKEIRNLLRYPIFFIQAVFPVIIIMVSVVNIFILVLSFFSETTVEEINISVDFEVICVILGLLQFLFSISGLSLTAISREGRDAVFIKYLPIDLYKQFLYKNALQIMLNFLVTIIVLVTIYYFIPTIGWLNIILLGIIATLLNFINSYLMLIIDIRRPNLNWDVPYTVVKKNPNKIFQYSLMIITILILMYLSTIFKEFELEIRVGLIIEMIIFLAIFVTIDILVRKFKNKLFNKIT